MRILHLNTETGWRGGERQTLLSLVELQAAGHETALCARSGSLLATRASAAGIQVFPFDGTAAMVRQLLRHRCSFDVMHAQTARAMTFLAVLRPLLKTAVVFTRRTAFAGAGAQRQRWKWSRADALVAISTAAAEAPRSLGLDVVIIPSAVQPMQAEPQKVQALRQLHCLDGKRVLLTAAALSPEKDPLTLIEAVAFLRESYPDVLCLHCGADGAAAHEARARVIELGLQEHYVFAGFQDNIANAMELAEVYVSSSRFEALGTSVLDACLAGLPVVATDVGGHREILDPDKGLLVPAGDARSLARRIAWVLEQRGPAAEMAARARQVVAQEFSVERMIQRYVSLYRNAMRR